MRTLDRKLLRDLWDIKGQAIAIALVVMCGVAAFVMSLSTLASLQETRAAYYARYRFGDVFARLKRAPLVLVDRIAAIPGIAQVQPRIVQDVSLDVPKLAEPAVGRLISIPERSTPVLNGLHLRRGRWVELGRPGEVLINEAFAIAHRLEPGDKVRAILNGRYQELKIVGVALSPEYVLSIREGQLLPDEKRFGIFWMGRQQLQAAFNMEGAFNDLTVSLQPDALEPEVIRQIDLLTKNYGGVGAFGRTDQLSHRYLSDEIRQLRSMGMIAPSIFLSVAAFLLNVVIGRVIRTQREQIAALRAFGYSKWAVAVHFLQLALLVTTIGLLLGIGVGSWMGHNLTRLYTTFYKFPIFDYQFSWPTSVYAALISIGAAIIGTWVSVRIGTSLPPAEAMRPEPPHNYRPTVIERLGWGHLLSTVARMIWRHLERRPTGAIMSCIGMALGVAVLILGSFTEDALNYLIQFQFFTAQRQDVTVAFVEPAESTALNELLQFPGVIHGEPFRGLATRIRHGHYARRVGIMGLSAEPRLYRLLTDREEPVALPPGGLMLSTKLAELLHVGLHDWVTVEVLEGKRPTWRLRVTGLIKELGGTNAYMELPALSNQLGESERISGAFLQVDARYAVTLYRQLKQVPHVASVNVKSAALESFFETVAKNMLRIRFFNVMFATVIAFGVVYNTARISLAERSRELATLRVIGFRRSEVSGILLGELAVITIASLPLGMGIGYLLSMWVAHGLDTELYRIPLVVNRATYGFSAVVILLAAFFSGFVVLRRISQLDLIGVLKTKE